MTRRYTAQKLAFVDMLVITRHDEPVSVRVAVIQPSGRESSVFLAAEQMDRLCEMWSIERMRQTIEADANKPAAHQGEE